MRKVIWAQSLCRLITLWSSLVVILLIAPQAFGQQHNTAEWAVGSGNWSTATNWNCQLIGGTTNVPCVPGANFAVTASGGQINLDTSESIFSFSGDTGTTLTLNGTSLSASQSVFAGAQITLTGGASITTPGVSTTNLSVRDSSIAANVQVAAPLNGIGTASIIDSTVSTLLLTGQLTLNGSTVSSNSNIIISVPSDIIGSTYNGSIFVDGASLGIKIGSTVNATGTANVGIAQVIVGNMTTGSVTVQDGSTFNMTSGNVLMGLAPGSSGTFTVQGINTTLNLHDQTGFALVTLGSATLTIQDNATLASQGTTTITLGGAGGLGANGAKQWNVLTGGTATITTLNLDGTTGSTAGVTVDGSGSQIDVTNVTVSGLSTIAVSNSGKVNAASNVFLGSGQITVQSGGMLTVSGIMGIGNALPPPLPTGDATLTVQGGGSGSNQQQLIIGSNAGSNGTMTVTGNDSTWTSEGLVTIGQAGTGTLNIADSGVLKANSGATLGDQATGIGTATVNGDDSTWNVTGTLKVGASGKGTLKIEDQATVEVDGDVSVGAAPGGVGSVNMQGGKLSLSLASTGKLIVGDQGVGTLTVVPGASQGDDGTITSREASIGAQAGSTGHVTIGSGLESGTIQATGSQWTVQGAIAIGERGTGTLDIGGNVTNFDASIGKEASGNGSVQVLNGGVWITHNDLTVGENGIGRLTIRNGGFAGVQFGQGVDVGQNSGSTGIVLVEGQWNIAQDLTIGHNGSGTMTIQNGGNVASGPGHIGDGLGTGTVVVTGSGTQGPSTWNANGVIIVGDGTGTLTISDGGQVLSQEGAIGTTAGAVGTVTITGTGSAWSAKQPGGTGTVAIGGNGGQGTLNVQDGGQLIATSVVVKSDGVLNGPGGSIVGNVINAGGMVTPGDATGTLSITGDYTQTAGTLLFEIDGAAPDQYDHLLISGNALFTGGTIDILFGNGFLPTAGERFDLLEAELGLTEQGVTVDVLGLPQDFLFSAVFGPNGLEFDIRASPPSTVPEPNSAFLTLLAFGLVVIMGWRSAPRGSSNRSQRR